LEVTCAPAGQRSGAIRQRSDRGSTAISERRGIFLAYPANPRLYHPIVAAEGHSGAPEPSESSTAADRVASILGAAEQTAERMRREAEERMRERIAEADRAAANRVTAAEEEAADILRQAREEAGRLRDAGRSEIEQAKTTAADAGAAILARANEDAEKIRSEAESAAVEARSAAAEALADAERRARDLLRAARTSASDVRTEGLEIAGNLTEMGESLRKNAQRLLRDVQLIHSRLVAEIDRADAELGIDSHLPRADAAQRGGSLPRPDDGEALDVPEFIPPG
jgi:hypothetical protein